MYFDEALIIRLNYSKRSRFSLDEKILLFTETLTHLILLERSIGAISEISVKMKISGTYLHFSTAVILIQDLK